MNKTGKSFLDVGSKEATSRGNKMWYLMCKNNKIWVFMIYL